MNLMNEKSSFRSVSLEPLIEIACMRSLSPNVTNVEAPSACDYCVHLSGGDQRFGLAVTLIDKQRFVAVILAGFSDRSSALADHSSRIVANYQDADVRAWSRSYRVMAVPRFEPRPAARSGRETIREQCPAFGSIWFQSAPTI